MPRVTEEYRQARRNEIARAALRCLARKGVRDTSIADIVEESGLSTGAIYSHFSNKAELARYIVSEFLFVRTEELVSEGRAGRVVTPREALERLIRTIGEEGIPPAVVVQFWGEASVDDELHAEMLRTVGTMRTAITEALTPWAISTGGDADAAARTAGDVMALAQGFIANSAVLGARDVDGYLSGVAAVFAG